MELRQRAIEQANSEWRAPIDFYGKVVDDNNNPVPESTVHFAWNNLSGSRSRQATSDSEGLFFLKGGEGKHLAVQVSKEGYYASNRDETSFFYAGNDVNFVPNQADPILFHLRKKRSGEPLIRVSDRIQVPLTGDAVGLDLFTGKAVPPEQGTLLVRCLSDVQNKNASKRYDWELVIIARDGGVLETPDEFPFLAPETGYQSQYEIQMLASTENGWQSSVEKNIFIRLADGKFARIAFLFLPHNGVFRFDCFANPSGSRNLEFDSAAQPKPTTFE